MNNSVQHKCLSGRSIVSLDDLSLDDLELIFQTADEFINGTVAPFGTAAGKIVATLFYEPSTRTRLSFEAAMQRLGGGVISTPDVKSSSTVKGESLADTVRVVGSYADIIVLRHPWEGSAQLASEYSPVPIINGGDGGNEHPTQTLCDLYTLREHHGSLKGLNVALCGDLQRGRTVHSLALALARFGANIIFVPGDNQEIPDYILNRLERDYNAHIQRERLGILSALFDNQGMNDPAQTVDAIYVTPTEPHQLAMSSLEGTGIEFTVNNGEPLSIYVTRRQSERGSLKDDGGRYPVVNARSLRSGQFKDISILHPLPRVDELSPDIDSDPRSLYFRQAALGIPIRMAVLWHVLGLCQGGSTNLDEETAFNRQIVKYIGHGFSCANDTCITNQEKLFTTTHFEIIRNENYELRCSYCGRETHVPFAGNTESKFYYPSELLDRFAPPVSLSHVRFFATEEMAKTDGFVRASAKWDKYYTAPIQHGKHWLDIVSGNLL